MKNNTINKKEIEKFSKIAEEWWNPEGKFKPLHKFNPIRIKYIRDSAAKHFKIKSNNEPLKNLNILDIGIGPLLTKCTPTIKETVGIMLGLFILSQENPIGKLTMLNG